MKELLIKTLQVCLGLFITGIGTSMMYLVHWGSSPAATINDGVHAALHLSYGAAGISVNLFFLVVLFFLDRKLISIGTILATFFMGIFVEVGLFFIRPVFPDSLPVVFKFLILLSGGVITAVGLGYYVGVNFGTGAIDGMSVALNRKFGIPFTVCRWCMDILITVIGVALGAAWGVGTIISVTITGPVMQAVMKYSQKSRRRYGLGDTHSNTSL